MIQTVTTNTDGTEVDGWHHDLEEGETWSVHAFTEPTDRDFRITIHNPKTEQDIDIDVVPIAAALELFRKLKAALREMKG